MRFYALVAIVLTCSVFGCSSGDSKARELFDTAQFEEKQNNFDHAVTLYEELIKKFPESPVSKDAANRLKVLRSRKP